MHPALAHKYRCVSRLVSALLIVAIVTITAPLAIAKETKYEVELVVSEGKKSVETDAVLTIKDDSFTVVPDKKNFSSASKDIAFSTVKVADYSYSKKPMLSGGGAIATALLVGFIFALPFLFIKKKKHWMTVQTEKDFAVIKLGDNNHRQIVAEFETHGIKVNEVKEDDKKNEK